MNILQISSIFPIPESSSENPYVFNYINHYLEKHENAEIFVFKPITYLPRILILLSNNHKYWKQKQCIIDKREQQYGNIMVTIFPYLSIGSVSLLHAFFSYWGFWMNRKTIKEKIQNADVIHAHYLFPDGLFAYMAKKKHGIPYMLTLRQEKRFLSNRITLWASRKIINGSFICSTQSVQMHDALTEVGIKSIKLLPTGIHPLFFASQPKAKERSDNKLRLISVCNLLPIKNLQNVIQAISETDATRHIGYDIYGTGPEEKRLIVLVRKLKLEDVIHFKGNINNEQLPLIYPDYDVFIQPSFKETFGLTYFEALACGLPVILTENTGAWPLIKEYDVAFVVNPDSTKSIADCLKSIIQNPVLLKQKRKRTREAAKIASWDNYIDYFHQAYQAAIEK